MLSNLYPLSNTAFINLVRAQFLCDLITRVLTDICAHIFQTIGKTIARTTAQTCIPFCSLLMKIMVLEGVCLPTDGKILARLRPLSMISLQASKSHSSKAPKSESLLHPLHPVMVQLHLCIPRLLLPLLLSYRRLALSLYILALKLTSWALWLRVCISAFSDLKEFYTLPKTKFKCISQPLRHS